MRFQQCRTPLRPRPASSGCDVLSLLALGKYDPALVQIELTDAQDRLSVLEQSLVFLVQELDAARRENRAHVAELEQRLQTIEHQQHVIRELSTPVIELWDQILTLPIIGTLDAQRSQEVTESLLHRITDSRARCVIIDVTGIDTIDTMTSSHFLGMIRAAELLGAHCVVTGMSPHAAQTMVGLGVDLGSIHTLRSLKQGLEHCLRFLQSREG
jgi:rsbT co-antagonist protein RsbR